MAILDFLGLRRVMPSGSDSLGRSPHSSWSPRLDDLLRALEDRGHPEHPFNHNRYAPESRVPASDFTPFIVECLKARDLAAVQALMEAIIAANPGLGTPGGWMAQVVEEVAALPVGSVITSDGVQCDLELRALFILGSLGGGDRAFWLAEDKPQLFSQALACHRLQFSERIAELRDRANEFIVRMREDTPYWRSFPLFDPPAVPKAEVPQGATLDAFSSLPCCSRLHLLALHKKGGGALSEVSTYSIRKLGLDLDRSAEILSSGGFVEPSRDPAAFVSTLTKRGLISLLYGAGVPTKSSWTKTRLAEELVTNEPAAAEELAADLTLVRPASEFETLLDAVSTRASEHDSHFKLLSFLR